MTRLLALPAIALAAMLPLPAQAQEKDDIDPAQMEAAVRYALPHLLGGLRTTCAGELSADGYLARRGDALMAKFSAGADAYWPQAKSVLLSIGPNDPELSPDMFAMLPDEALKPFIDGIVSVMVASEVKPEQCTDIERGLELVDPLPAANLAGLVRFLIEMDKRDEAESEAAGEAAGD